LATVVIGAGGTARVRFFCCDSRLRLRQAPATFTDRGGEAMKEAAQRARAGIRRPASLTIDPERLERMSAMTPAQRRQAADRGQLSLGEMLRWAARHPDEVPLVDGEFSFMTGLLADSPETGEAACFWRGDHVPLPEGPAASQTPAASTVRQATR
jgi:phytoene dehydrogenase-like protein